MLKNKNIVIIGGAGSLGGEFVKEAHSGEAHCVILDNRKPVIKIPFFQTDITSLEQMTISAGKAIDLLGNIDIVVNFAGTHHMPMDFYKDDPNKILSEYRRVLEVNLTGAFLVTMIFGKRMISQRHGHIIHICSNASRLSLYGSYAYNISKHGLEGLIKTAATQFAPFGVRVNGIAPGTVETPLNYNLLHTGQNGEYSERAASILAHTPTKRFATLQGIVETIIAACMEQRHLTGNIIFCDDGYNVEGHSWPQGNAALYEGPDKLDDLFNRLDQEYPHEDL